MAKAAISPVLLLLLLLPLPRIFAFHQSMLPAAPTRTAVHPRLTAWLQIRAAADGGVSKPDQPMRKRITRFSSTTGKLPLLVLTIVPLAFGSYETAIQLVGALSDVHALLLQCGTYAIACAFVCIVRLLRERNVRVTRFEWQAGIQLGLCISVAATLQSLGLQRTTAMRAGFLVRLSTIFVPIIEAVLRRRRLGLLLSAAVSSTFLGVVLMVLSPAGAVPGMRAATWTGDALVALSTVFYTIHILRLSVLAKAGAQPWPLATAKSATQFVASTICLLSLCLSAGLSIRGTVLGAPPALPHTVLFTGIVTCAFPMWAQGYGQQTVRAAHATLIYATAPVWNALFAAVLLGERLAPRALLGACFLMLGMVSAMVASARDDVEDEGKRSARGDALRRVHSVPAASGRYELK